MSRQAVLLYIATQGLLDDVPVEQIRPFAEGFLEKLAADHAGVLDGIQETGALSGVAAEAIREALAEYMGSALQA